MLAFFYDFLILFAASGGEGQGGFMDFYNKYLNYPGLEAWKFLNLLIFIAILGYILKKPLGEAFKARREAIRGELIRAEEARKAALAKLTSAEARLASLDNERQLVLNRAKMEADAEKARLLEQAESEVAKLREQTEGEVARLTQLTKAELKRFSAEESVRRAEEKLRSRIDANADANLVKSGIQAIGGLS
jgi:F0F1-type ATP synthase membrane subunit b/b'